MGANFVSYKDKISIIKSIIVACDTVLALANDTRLLHRKMISTILILTYKKLNLFAVPFISQSLPFTSNFLSTTLCLLIVEAANNSSW